MGDLQDVDARQATADERRVEVVLGVAGQQEPTPGDLAEQDDRRVVDRPTGLRDGRRDGRRVGPQRTQTDVVDGQLVAGSEPRRRAAGRAEGLPEGRVARTATRRPGLEHVPDAVALEDERQSRDVVLVGVGEDDRVEAPVPGRDPRVELDEEAVGIGPTVDEQPAAARPLEEDRVALADVEHRQVGPRVGSSGRDERQGEERATEADGAEAEPPAKRSGPIRRLRT